MPATIQKWGNSLGLRIPRAIAEQVLLAEGTEVELDATGGVLTIRPKRRRKYKLSDLLAKAKGKDPHGEIDRGSPVGREMI